MNQRQSPESASLEVKPHEAFERDVIKLQENLRSLETETTDLIKDRQQRMIEIKEELHSLRKRASMLTTE
jgi:hypothetical protein